MASVLSPRTLITGSVESHGKGRHLILRQVGEFLRVLSTAVFRDTPNASHFYSDFPFALRLYCSNSTSCAFGYQKG